MGGSSNTTGGKGSSFSKFLNPASVIGNVLGVESGKSTLFDPFGLGTLNPVDDMQTQAINNTMNVASGKEQFGAHSNWFGSSAVGDTMNPMMGGRTQEENKAWDKYERANLAGWEKWSQNTGKANPHADRMTSKNNSLLLDDDEL